MWQLRDRLQLLLETFEANFLLLPTSRSEIAFELYLVAS